MNQRRRRAIQRHSFGGGMLPLRAMVQLWAARRESRVKSAQLSLPAPARFDQERVQFRLSLDRAGFDAIAPDRVSGDTVTGRRTPRDT